MAAPVRKLVVTEFVSLDGVYQAPGGPEEDTRGGFKHGGWSLQFWGEEAMQYKSNELSATDAILIGRVTYEIFAGAWPTMVDDDVVKLIKDGGGDADSLAAAAGDGNAFADKMNSLPKYVVSRTLKKVEWSNSTLIKGDLAEEIGKLKRQPGGDIVVHGSGDLAQSLMAEGLVDEYRLMVFPTVLGSGFRLFGTADETKHLRLVDTKPFKTGVVVLTYEPTREGGAK